MRILPSGDTAKARTNLDPTQARLERGSPRLAPLGRDARGLASVYGPKGRLIAFATSPSQVGKDGPKRIIGLTLPLESPYPTADLMQWLAEVD